MQSWQSKVIERFFRLRNIIKPKRGYLDVEKARAENEALASYFKSKVKFESLAIDANGVPAEWINPEGALDSQVILYFHGGAYNSGSINTHRSMVADLSDACRARSLVLGYRLAPEHFFPAAVEDSRAAYEWLLGQDIPAGNIILAGDSAGGGLVMALLLDLRDAGRPLPAGGVCLSPWVDLTCSGETWETNAGRDVFLDPGSILESADVYLNGIDPKTPKASPVFADLTDLPPLLIQVGSSEYLLSDAADLNEKARGDGVDVTLEVYEGMQHEWHFAARFLPEARHAIAQIGKFARIQFGESL